jgi:hypothetical protein
MHVGAHSVQRCVNCNVIITQSLGKDDEGAADDNEYHGHTEIADARLLFVSENTVPQRTTGYEKGSG